ncbi:DNA ligase [Sulfurimonas sp.]|uniref:DNA ligase n=1 Tax=Sulfurimonas sp. TaxID=2022749 RepID=UPI0026273418|nr:DNA ligase [Sulfurimonas sp.]
MIKIFLFFLLPFILLADKPNLLLLKTYKDQNISGWVMSEKLDGIRAYWDGKYLLSRGGKIIHAPAYFTKEFPPFAIDGELWSKRSDFSHISSIVRDRVPSREWSQISYNIFEVPNAVGGLFERLEKVQPYKSNILKIIPQIAVKSKENMRKFLKSVEAKGGEGLVVRDPNAVYIAKRTSKALKVKSFLDAECRVIGYTKGKGKYSGKLGALKCQLNNGEIFKIGSGFSDVQRENPPAIGSRVTFKYKELTKNGKPRFPVYMRLFHE